VATIPSPSRRSWSTGGWPGHVLRFDAAGHPEVSYWLGKDYWGQGIATRALAAFLCHVRERPLYARAARDNRASLRVLHKCGFTITGEDKGFSNACGVEIEEYILTLGQWGILGNEHAQRIPREVKCLSALPALIAGGDGRLVNVSSIGGRVAFPTYGAYAAAKFALEGFSDALRREVGRLGVKVIVIEPGTIATPMWGKGIATMDELATTMTADQHARYDDLIAAMHKQAEGQAGSGIPPLRAATVIVTAIQARKPRARYLVGRDATLLAGLAGLLSDHMLDRLVSQDPGHLVVRQGFFGQLKALNWAHCNCQNAGWRTSSGPAQWTPCSHLAYRSW